MFYQLISKNVILFEVKNYHKFIRNKSLWLIAIDLIRLINKVWMIVN